MKRELIITPLAIDESALVRNRAPSDGMGAVAYFSGVVRGLEEGRALTGIEYEAFEKMACHQLEIICDQIEKRWPIESVRLVHRVGFVKTNETSLWVEILSPHRGEAFAACQYLIDELKRVVPIWKKPIT